MCLSHFGKSPAKSLTLEMGLPSPLTPSTWTESVLHTQLQKERKSKQLPYPRICCQSQQRRGRSWRDIRILVQFPDRRQQRGRVQVPWYEVLSGMAQCQWAGSCCCSFSELVAARACANPPLQPSLLWLSPSLQFTSENGTQACPSPIWAPLRKASCHW